MVQIYRLIHATLFLVVLTRTPCSILAPWCKGEHIHRMRSTLDYDTTALSSPRARAYHVGTLFPSPNSAPITDPDPA